MLQFQTPMPPRVRAAVRAAVRASAPRPAAARRAAKDFAAEREHALELMKEIDEAEAIIRKAAKSGFGKPRPTPGYWREVEKQVEAKRAVD